MYLTGESPHAPPVSPQEPPVPRRALLVVGMHRSGTSALTRVLSLCGAGLPAQLMRGRLGNETGHWEPERIVDAHDAFLQASSSSWTDLAPIPVTEPVLSAQTETLARQLATLVEEEYRGASLLVIKDPRLALVLPVWRTVLPSLGIEPFAIIPIRDPVEVARSLAVRDGVSAERTLVLWLRYMLCAERYSRGLRRCFVSYPHLLDDWRATVAGISSRTGLEFPAVTDEAASEIGRFLRKDLRHQSGAQGQEQRLAVPPIVARAAALFAAAAEGDEPDPQVMDALSAELDAAWSTLGGAFHRADQTAEQLRWQLVRVEEHSSTLTAQLKALRAAAADAQRAVELARSEAELERARRQAMESSVSWTLTTPLRETSGRYPGLAKPFRALARLALGRD